MVRLGYQRDDQAKNIGSISSGLFRRWKEREKTQGPQKKETRKKLNTKTRGKKMRRSQKEEKKKEETQLSTQGPPKKKEKKKEEKQLNSKQSQEKKRHVNKRKR